MSAGVFNANRLDRIVERLAVYADIDAAEPLATRLELVIVEANRRNLLNGLDGDGNAMTPTKYRGGFAIHAKTRKANFGKTKGAMQGHGPLASGLHGNLSAAEYRALSGPPLVPRGEGSRLITNLATRHYLQGQTWVIEGAWLDVVSTKGVPFLAAHFEGQGRLPKRDPRGIGPFGRKLALEAVAEWARGVRR